MKLRALPFLLLCLLIASPVQAEEPAEMPLHPPRMRTALHWDHQTDRLDRLESKVRPLVAEILALEKTDREGKEKALSALSDDPLTLYSLARKARVDGEEATARYLFERSIAAHEINLYERLAGTRYQDILELEFFGKFEEARAAWVEAYRQDPLTSYFMISRYSRIVSADLLEGLVSHVRGVVDAAKKGEDAVIYQPRPNSPRNLEVMDSGEALEAFKSGKPLRYVYIDKLDLTGQTFDEPVMCQRCVIGELEGYNSTFKDRFILRGFVLGDFNVGKSWTGEVNRSRSIPASSFDSLVLDKVVVLGDLKLNSIDITGSTASFPFTVVEGAADLRNIQFREVADFRFFQVKKEVDLKGTRFDGPSYFGHLIAGGMDLTRVVSRKNSLLFDSAVFTGPVRASRCELDRGATFENAVFGMSVDMRHCRVGDRLNFSRAGFLSTATFEYLELDDIEFFGAMALEDFALSDSIIRGNARFAVDGLNRRLHLGDPHGLHALYKQYQGDIDSDDALTDTSQYGVVHVDDLTASFRDDASFANTIFEKFVGFEAVAFGSSMADEEPDLANFYNAQFYGEAHFERASFFGIADFRTISGNEISFNAARFHHTWILDDANVPGRLSVNDIVFVSDATLSFYGARLAYFGITMPDLVHDESSRLFYERCIDGAAAHVDDPRMLAARWDFEAELARTDAAEIERRAQQICLDRAIGEFVVLRDSFTSRGMTEEADWAYWHLRHYDNLRDRERFEGLALVGAWAEWLFFEKAFGWGVHLVNLFWTSLVVILVFMLLIRLLCGSMVVDWDDSSYALKDLPTYALFVISLHSFLGRARDWKSKSSNKVWKVLYTTEMIIGILLITFFIGAYARIILR